MAFFDRLAALQLARKRGLPFSGGYQVAQGPGLGRSVPGGGRPVGPGGGPPIPWLAFAKGGGVGPQSVSWPGAGQVAPLPLAEAIAAWGGQGPVGPRVPAVNPHLDAGAPAAQVAGGQRWRWVDVNGNPIY